MFEYIELNKQSTELFLKIFCEELTRSDTSALKLSVNTCVGNAYERLFIEDEHVKKEYEVIFKRDKDHADIFFASQLQDIDLNSTDGMKYTMELNIVLDHLKRNYIKMRRKKDPYYMIEHTPMEFYEYKGYNDNTPPD